jgi:hypothetical protein
VAFAPGVVSRCRDAVVPGLVASAGLGVGLLVASRFALRSDGWREGGVTPYLLLGAPTLVLVASAIAGTRGRTFGAGVRTAVGTVALGALLVAAVGTVEASHWHQHGRLIFDGDRISPPGGGPDAFTWGLLLLPLWWLPFGVLGAALGRRLHRSIDRDQAVT